VNRFWILTFYTEGEPHDQGENLVAVEREFRRLVAPVADEYVAHCPRSIKEDGDLAATVCADCTQWLAEHPLRHQLLRYSRRWARIGFLRWKPYIIRKLLLSDDVRNEDIILYHDVDISTYPVYTEGITDWRELCVHILDELSCDIFVPTGLPLERDVKAFLVRKYLGDAHRRDPGVWAGLMVLRKSAQAIAFVNEWLEMSMDLDNISPLPNPDPYVKMEWHSVDQSVLGVLGKMWSQRGLLPSGWPRYYVQGRRFSFPSLSRSSWVGRFLTRLGIDSLRLKAWQSRAAEHQDNIKAPP
jgi:hypothetical protein